jgi:Protein of unknown function (DUF3489)/IclR helix-turn-helix domain
MRGHRAETETTPMKKAKKIIATKIGKKDAPPKAAAKKTIALKVKRVPKADTTAGAVKGKTTRKPTTAAVPIKTVQAAEPTPEVTRANEVNAPRSASKGAKILELISRADGATLAEIMMATGWQKHSVRGFISTAGKKVTIESSKSAERERTYRRITA